MRRGATLALVSIVVVTACSDDGVPMNDASTRSDADETADAETLPSTITTDTNPSTDPSGTSENPDSTAGDTTGIDPTDATTTDATTTDASTSTSDATGPTSGSTSSDSSSTDPGESSSSAASSSESTGSGASCGDGIIEGDELCDGDDLGDVETCADLGYSGGPLGCDPAACLYDESGCNDEPAFAIDFCRLQFPLSIVDSAGVAVDVFGRVYIAGLTDVSLVGNDVAANVAMQVGYGPDGSDPEQDAAGWTWTSAAPNASYGVGSPSFELNNDEYSGTMILPPVGEYDFAVRFTGDGTGTWTVCDGGDAGSSDGYAPADAGQLTSL